MKTSKSTKTSNPSSFTGMSPNGDLTEAFGAAKKSLQSAGLETNNLGAVSVTITLKALQGDDRDDVGGKQPKDLPFK